MTSETGEVQQISPEVISQILSSMEKQDQMASHVEPQATQAKLAKGKGRAVYNTMSFNSIKYIPKLVTIPKCCKGFAG